MSSAPMYAASRARSINSTTRNPMEIERKYLIATLPPLAGVLSNNILQGYLAIDDTHEVRLRQIGPDYILTVKVGTGLVRQEHETVISKQQFSLLWPAVNNRSVSKVRYYLPDDISVDIYEGPLAGLTVAEIEFDTVRASDSYIPPHWFGPEVTSDLRFKNRSLASAGTIPSIDQDISKE